MLSVLILSMSGRLFLFYSHSFWPEHFKEREFEPNILSPKLRRLMPFANERLLFRAVVLVGLSQKSPQKVV